MNGCGNGMTSRREIFVLVEKANNEATDIRMNFHKGEPKNIFQES